MEIDWHNVKMLIREYLRGDVILSYKADDVIIDMIKNRDDILQKRFGTGFTIASNTVLIEQCVEEAISEFEKLAEQIKQYSLNPVIYSINDRIKEMIVRLKEVQETLN